MTVAVLVKAAGADVGQALGSIDGAREYVGAGGGIVSRGDGAGDGVTVGTEQAATSIGYATAPSILSGAGASLHISGGTAAEVAQILSVVVPPFTASGVTAK